jgi:lysophospholipase L1-like esterase
MKRRLGFASLSLVLVLGAGEVAARCVLPPPPPTVGIALDEDPDILWTLSGSDHQPPNSLGLRGREPAPRSSVHARILTLGDSSVYGDTVGEDEVFSTVAARMLSGSARVDAANGGVPGYSTVQAAVLYGRVHDALGADVVVIGTLWSDAAPGEETDVEHLARVRADLGRWGPVNRAMRAVQSRSTLLRLVRQLLHGNLSLRAAKPPPAQKVGWVHADENLPLGTFSRVSVEEYGQNLRALVERVRADGALPVFLLLPHPYDDLGRALPERLLRYRRAMRTIAGAAAVPLVDCESWFGAHPSGGSRFSDDIHPNVQGHAAIAEALSALLRADPQLGERLGATSLRDPAMRLTP